MSPLALDAALLACLTAGVVDVAVLNLAVVPALDTSPPARLAATTPVRSSSKHTTQLTAAIARVTRSSSPAQVPEPEPLLTPAPDVTSSDGDAPPTLLAVLEFETESHHIGASQRSRLRQSLASLRSATHITVVGHADPAGPADFNQRLSQERADAAVHFLVERGIPAERLQSIGRGEHEPLAYGNSRRVEIYIGGTP